MDIRVFMSLMRRNKLPFFRCLSLTALWAAALFSHAVCAQSSPIALPQGTVEGRLENGFHYLIMPNHMPASRVEVRLIMRAGSILETEQEKGCAHFLEHMAFQGTTHFPGRSLVESLEKLGMRYGQDINAFTGFDRTVYMFAVPVDKDKEAVMKHSLLIVRDWLQGMSIDSLKVENEKGVILEELRGYNLGDEFYPLKIGTGLFSRRMPLGSVDDIRRVTPRTLKNFYRKWYVPSLATLAIAGDVSPLELEQEIKTLFSGCKGNASVCIPFHPLQYDEGIHLSEVRDTLRNRSRLELMIPHACVVERTVNDAVRKEQERLLVKALTTRLNDRKQRCEVSDQWYLSDKNHFTLSVEGKSREELLSCVTTLAGELYCLAREGWQPEEWQDIKKDFCRKYDKTEDYSSRSSAMWCDDFTDYVISGDRYLTDETQRKQVAAALHETSQGRLQQLLEEWLAARQETLLAACSSHSGMGKPLTTEEIATAWDKGRQASCRPYQYVRPQKTTNEPHVHTPDSLSARHPFNPAYIADSKTYPRTGVRDVRLKNGIRLVLKPTLQSETGLLLTSFAPSGLASIPEKEYPFLEGAAGYMDMGGISGMTGDSLSEYLYRQEMSLTSVIENHWHGFIGMSPSSKAAEFFNLIYQKITAPQLNYEDFEEVRAELLAASGKETVLEKMLKRDSDRLLAARMSELMGETLATSCRQPGTEQLQRLNLDSIAAYYKTLYARPEGMTYVISGNFDADTLIRQFAAVFGRMPASTQKTTRQCTEAPRHEAKQHTALFRLPDTKLVEGFPCSHETQTLFDYLFFGHYRPGLKNTLVLKLMRDIIRNRLISILREQKSLVYSPYVSLKYEGLPRSIFYFDIHASADNDRMHELGAALKQLLERLRREEVDEEELQTLKRSFLIAKRETLNEEAASAWRTTLTELLKNGETPADFDDYEQHLASISPAVLREAFERYIDVEKYVLLYISKKLLEE